MDVHDQLVHLMRERGWTAYRLAKNCGLSESTIANLFRRNTLPTIDTLETVCEKGFGITLSQFFAEGETIELTPDLKELVERWIPLTPTQKAATLHVMRAMSEGAETKLRDGEEGMGRA